MTANFESGILRTPAWHGEGIVRPGDGWFTLDEMLTALPDTLGSPVATAPLMAVVVGDDGDVRAVDVPGRYATVRASDKRVLGVVSERYRVVQNADALSFGEAIIGAVDGAVWETAGTLRDGSWAWGLIRLPEDVLIGGLRDEAVSRRMLITNCHDGTAAVRVKATYTRVVCENTWRAALAGAGDVYSVRHTGDLDAQLDEAQTALKVLHRWQKEMENTAAALLDVNITERDVDAWLATILPDPQPGPDGKEPTPRAVRNAVERREALRTVWQQSDNLDNVRWTAWGAFQAAVEWDQHVRYSTADGDARMRRFLDDRPFQTAALSTLLAQVWS